MGESGWLAGTTSSAAQMFGASEMALPRRAIDSFGGSARPFQVHIHEAPGTKAKVEQDRDGNLSVIIEQVEQAMSTRMNRGSGLATYLDSRYRRRL